KYSEMNDKIRLLVFLITWLVSINAFSQTIFDLSYVHGGSLSQATVIFDMNGDTLPDFATANKRNLYIVKNLGGGAFVEHDSFWVDISNGFGSHDFNGDGLLDFTIAQRDGSVFDNWINTGSSSFIPTNSGNESVGATRNVIYADFNNDGFADSYHSASAFQFLREGNQFHQGTGMGLFGPDIIETILDPPIPGFWYDSLVHPDYGPQYWSAKQSKGVIVRDLDLDGKADIVNAVYCDLGFQPDTFTTMWVNQQERGLFILRNNSTAGLIRFEEVSHPALGSDAHGNDSTFWNPYGAVPLDYDRDGDFDLIIGGTTRQNEDTDLIRFYENISIPGTVQFIEKTSETGLEYINELSVSVKRLLNYAAGVPIDYNNDSWTDIIFINRKDGASTFAPYAFLFRNNGDNTFSLIPFEEHGLGGVSGGRDINIADLNQDGRMDVIISDGTVGGYEGTDSTLVYINHNPDSNNWIQFDIKTLEGGTWAFFSTIKIYPHGTLELIGMDDIRTDLCYRSKRYPVLHFGLGEVDTVDVEIFRNGTHFFAYVLPANQVHYLYLDELATGLEEAISIPISYSISVYPNPFNSVCKIAIIGAIHELSLLSIFDIHGRLVYRSTLNFGISSKDKKPTFNLDESGYRIQELKWIPEPNLSSGVYIIKAEFGSKSNLKQKTIYLK
ncbi:VCBS repeat-containing protein, partial [bacterium]|nr:VCBS repeat-containing protein [bacterium]